MAGEAYVAVAANFAAPVRALAAAFEKRSGHRLVLSTGSTGKLYAQVRNGAPFDAFLSADAQTPARLESEALAVSGQSFTYALGKLVLWSPAAALVDARGDVLRQGAFKRLAIANPRLAPYGTAAREAMEKLGVWHALKERLVLGENIAQAFQFVHSGNVELGFVAYSQIREPGRTTAGSYWLVPQALYAPIRQDAALLARGAGNAAARQFLGFLRGAQARELIRNHGYDLP
ncbi:MAG: molybdate ABC transporter substrate-binding protein [Burkholderiales bacterium]